MQSPANGRVFHVTDYGADPTGATDATAAIKKAIADAFTPPSNATMTGGIPDLGGAEIHLDGGTYLIDGPLTLPASGGGNFKVKYSNKKQTDYTSCPRTLWADLSGIRIRVRSTAGRCGRHRSSRRTVT